MDEIDRVLNAVHAFDVLNINHRAVVDRSSVKSAFHLISKASCELTALCGCFARSSFHIVSKIVVHL